MFNECLFHLCGCTCSNVMCVCSTICGSNQKYFCSFCLLLEVIYITHVFQVVFVWKTCFLGVFMTHFICKFNWELNGPNLMFSTLYKEFRDCFASSSRVRLTREKFRESASRENVEISFLKGISWDICFKLLPSSPKPLFQCFYIKTQLN